MGFVGGLFHGRRLRYERNLTMWKFEEEVKKIRQMEKDDFLLYINERRSDIHSFPGLIPPNGALFLGFLTREDDTYSYYMDPEGEIYYESDKGRAFEKKMEKAIFRMELQKKARENGS